MSKKTDPNQTIKVSKLKNGSVIDHLIPGTAIKALKVLGLSTENILSIGMNYDSEKYGKKDIIKIENRKLTTEEINKLALISPNATYSVVKNYETVEKNKAVLPDELNNIIKCNNPRCITNHEQVTTRFNVLNKEPIVVKCRYCEKRMTDMEIDIL